ncbi:hypothetical protein MNBD_GAMMA02-1343 [hydrothermal vent metagenome]|uniref:Uncharacterized protein n=1 Tax=hydrothermal vent metagenome TaxID=652676 RepID=A0A3B0W6L9_9ZZZZ
MWQDSHPLNEKALKIALSTAQNLAKLPIKFNLTDSLKLNKI